MSWVDDHDCYVVELRDTEEEARFVQLFKKILYLDKFKTTCTFY